MQACLFQPRVTSDGPEGRHRQHEGLPGRCIAIGHVPTLLAKAQRCAVPEAVFVPHPQGIPGWVDRRGRESVRRLYGASGAASQTAAKVAGIRLAAWVQSTLGSPSPTRATARGSPSRAGGPADRGKGHVPPPTQHQALLLASRRIKDTQESLRKTRLHQGYAGIVKKKPGYIEDTQASSRKNQPTSRIRKHYQVPDQTMR